MLAPLRFYKFLTTLTLLMVIAINGFSQSGRTFDVYSEFGPKPAIAHATVNYQFIPYSGKMYLAYDSKVKILADGGYLYKGKVYRREEVAGLGMLLDKLTGFSAKVELKIFYKASLRGAFTCSISGPLMGMLGDRLEIGNASAAESTDLNNWRVEGVSLVNYLQNGVRNWLAVEHLLDKHEFDKKRMSEFELLMETGRTALQSKEFAKARIAYEKALEYRLREQFVKDQLQLALKGIDQSDKKSQHENLMALAEGAESKKKYNTALDHYKAALLLGYDANNTSSRIRKIEVEIRKVEAEEEEQIRKAKLVQDAQNKEEREKEIQAQQVEQLKQLAELRDQNEKKELAKIEVETRKKIVTDLDQARRKAQEEEDQKEKNRLEAKRLDKEEQKGYTLERIGKLGASMEHNPEQLKIALEEAREVEQEARAVLPYGAFENMRVFNKLESYVDEIRDEQEEPKRKAAYERFYQLLFEEWQLLEKAQSYYMIALSHAQHGSSMHKYIVDKIKSLDDRAISTKSTIDERSSMEQSRMKLRAENKILLQMNRLKLNKENASKAFHGLKVVAYGSGNYEEIQTVLQQERDLVQRMNLAQEESKEVTKVQTAVIDGALSIITNSNLEAGIYKHNSIGLNARLGLGLLEIPIVTNWAAKDFIPHSDVEGLPLVSVLAEMDFWAFRNKYIDLGISGGGVAGIATSEGSTGTYFFQYHSTAKINLGVKRIKFAFEGNYSNREAESVTDVDVAKANSNMEAVPGQPVGVIVDGSFKYSLRKIGAGLHIDFSDQYTERYLRMLVYSEQPSFLKNSFFKEPIYSYGLELLVGTGFTLGGEYANNYIIGGTQKYELNHKNKSFYFFRIGKVFTLVKSK